MLARRLLLGAAAAALAWGVVLAVTGGLVLHAPWGRISSRNAARPLALSALAAAVYGLAYGRAWRSDLGLLLRIPWPRAVAIGAAAIALHVGLRYGSFVAGGADASGYISQSELWRQGRLIVEAPAWVADAAWPEAAWTATPLGYVLGPRPSTQVPSYAPGLPLLMAAFRAVGGPWAAFLVVPVLGVAAVLSTCRIAARFAGPWAGAAAAILLVSSPPFLLALVMPMTDVPVTAFWALAILLALRRSPWSAAGAGLAASAAIVTRPNLVPLAGVVAILAVAVSGRWRNAAAFACGVLPSAVFIGALHDYLYDSPLRSGYGSLEELYSLRWVLPNVRNYGTWLLSTATPVLALAAAAPFVTPVSSRYGRRVACVVAVLFPLTLVALYLPYYAFSDWSYLRFLLPAYPSLCAGTAAVIAWLAHRHTAPYLGAAAACVLVAALAVRGFGYSDAPFGAWWGDERYARAAEHAARLPANAVLVSMQHSGSLRYYTGRSILRWDLLDPEHVDAAVSFFGSRGQPLYVIVDDAEMPRLTERLRGSRFVERLATATPVTMQGVRIYAMSAGSSRP